MGGRQSRRFRGLVKQSRNLRERGPYPRGMWRQASPMDDDAIVRMCVTLNDEDPGPDPVPPAHARRTLEVLREEPVRGGALVLEIDGGVFGYALLIAFWSNELGGEVCTIDELYIAPSKRGRGHATRLFEELAAETKLWPSGCVALA